MEAVSIAEGRSEGAAVRDSVAEHFVPDDDMIDLNLTVSTAEGMLLREESDEAMPNTWHRDYNGKHCGFQLPTIRDKV